MLTKPNKYPALIVDIKKREGRGFRARVLLALSIKHAMRLGETHFKNRHKVDTLFLPTWRRIARSQRWDFLMGADDV